MTKKRYKKLLMSTGIQRNMAERMTVWGRQQSIPINRRSLHFDAFRIGFLYSTRHFTKTLYAIGALTSSMVSNVTEMAKNVYESSLCALEQLFEGGDLDG